MTTKRTHAPCRRDSLSSSNRDQVTKHEMAPNGPAAISHSTAPMYRPAGRHSAWRHHSRPLYDSVHHLGRRAAVATATGRAPAPNLVARATPSIERCPKADSWRSSAPRFGAGRALTDEDRHHDRRVTAAAPHPIGCGAHRRTRQGESRPPLRAIARPRPHFKHLVAFVHPSPNPPSQTVRSPPSGVKHPTRP